MKFPFALPVVLATLRTVARFYPFAISATSQMVLLFTTSLDVFGLESRNGELNFQGI